MALMVQEVAKALLLPQDVLAQRTYIGMLDTSAGATTSSHSKMVAANVGAVLYARRCSSHTLLLNPVHVHPSGDEVLCRTEEKGHNHPSLFANRLISLVLQRLKGTKDSAESR
ncbi:uncharacterized protein LOC123411484 isoform X2 [Hordeum vulgare subsp. vulgare]|uniref:uncharacterized protein LOC123411484 isoform X2 n=1 Tax=Hordeum vulgare subsp. vulgare TaxID=112509 RepID=UPI00162EDAB3|nr:uncharacterized protein LOC123411484 isoform X2 [Hordeum vulgare subsp. vulgare]